jgi:hypothetical protein
VRSYGSQSQAVEDVLRRLTRHSTVRLIDGERAGVKTAHENSRKSSENVTVYFKDNQIERLN